MSPIRKFVAAIAVPAAISAGIITNAGVGEAAATYKFRLSNFSGMVANICVVTDIAQKDGGEACSGSWATGKSEVFSVKANSLDGWHCRADSTGKHFESRRFSRSTFKECVVHGTVFNPTIDLK